MTTMTTKQPSRQHQHIIPPSLAWLAVFVPAVAYFIASRFNLTGQLGTPVLASFITAAEAANDAASTAASAQLLTIFPSPITDASVMLVLANLTDITSAAWMNDAELGRGFILLSSSTAAGRVWRWERGGGPIPIGKTLFLEQSGCRSTDICTAGSGAIAVDFQAQETSLQGKLMVAEWGEQRIIRLEESGARTPLILQVPDVCHPETSTVRLHQPTSMLMTPFGDLIVVDHAADCRISVVWRLQKAMQVPALQSAWDSRLAHKWTQVQHNHSLDKVLQASRVGGIALDGTWEGLYAVVRGNGGKVRLLLVPLLPDEDDEQTTPKETQTIMDISDYTATPGPLVMDKSQNLYVGLDDGILIVSPAPHKVLGKLQLPERPVTLTIGEDGFFYVSSTTNLYRFKIKIGPMMVPTNLVKKTR